MRLKIDLSNIASQSQAQIRVQSKISGRSLTETIFTPPFVGKNFFRGIMINSELPFGKDAANCPRLLLSLGRRLFAMFSRLTGDQRESVLIMDDSPYDRSRSKWVSCSPISGITAS